MTKIVSWYALSWEQLTPEIKDELRAHLKNMNPERKDDYIKYLTAHMRYPIGELGL